MKHIVSFSGGKDSTAMLLHMIELDMQIDDIVFADTGLEFPELYEYIHKIEQFIGRQITMLKPEKTWDDWFYGLVTRGEFEGKRRGFPLVLSHCWWHREAKFKQLEKICKGNYRYIGIAIDEAHRMMNDEGYCYPLINWGWTERTCLEYLQKRNIANSLYERFDRLGCYLCPKQSDRSLRSLWKFYPVLWDKLKKYEKDSPHGFRIDGCLDDIERRFQWEDMQMELDFGGVTR